MTNYLFGLLCGMIIGLFIQQSLRFIAQIIFAKRVGKMLKRLEDEANSTVAAVYAIPDPSKPIVNNASSKLN